MWQDSHFVPDSVAASIGPVTSDAFLGKAMQPALEAPKRDIPGLAAAIVRHFKK